MATYTEHDTEITECNELECTTMNSNTNINTLNMSADLIFTNKLRALAGGIASIAVNTSAPTTLTLGGPWVTLPVVFTGLVVRGISVTPSQINIFPGGFYGTTFGGTGVVASNTSSNRFEIGFSINGADPTPAEFAAAVQPIGSFENGNFFNVTFLPLGIGALTLKARFINAQGPDTTDDFSLVNSTLILTLFGDFVFV